MVELTSFPCFVSRSSAIEILQKSVWFHFRLDSALTDGLPVAAIIRPAKKGYKTTETSVTKRRFVVTDVSGFLSFSYES